MKIQPIRGTHDIYGKNLLLYRFIEKTISKLAQVYDYNEIITPIFESTDLFKKPLGEQSEIVLKEMYSFKDRNNSSLTLRPEYTTPMIRASISNNLLDKLPVKLFGFGPMFRRERPQKGRFRQFNQINIEILGTNDSCADAEIIILANKLLEKILTKKTYKLFINSLGDKSTINKYKENLTNFFEKYKNDLSEGSKNKIYSNPLRILDSKNIRDINLSNNSPKIEKLYTTSAKKKFEEVQILLSNSNINFEINKNLVRGLDYYCHTVFEFKSESLGSQDTIIGGGRYDGLMKMLGGPDIPGVGWASGVERLMMLSKKIDQKPVLVHVIILDEKFKIYGFHLINELRKKNIKITFDYKYNLKKSLKNANSNNTKFALIVGEEEFNNKRYSIKNLSDGNQKELSLKEVVELLQA